MPTEARAALSDLIRHVADVYANALLALPEFELTHDRGVRLPMDYTYEVVLVNRRIAARLAGKEPGPFPEWPVVAPELFREARLAADEVRDSAAEAAAAWDALGDRAFEAKALAHDGERPALVVAFHAVDHMEYHRGQLSILAQQLGVEFDG